MRKGAGVLVGGVSSAILKRGKPACGHWCKSVSRLDVKTRYHNRQDEILQRYCLARVNPRFILSITLRYQSGEVTSLVFRSETGRDAASAHVPTEARSL